MTKQQLNSRETLYRLLECNLKDIRHIKRDANLVSINDIKRVYKTFNIEVIGKDKEMLIGQLRGHLYSEIEEKILDSLEL